MSLLILDEKPSSDSSLAEEKQAAEISALQESVNDAAAAAADIPDEASRYISCLQCSMKAVME